MPGKKQYYNRYAYVGNNPLSLTEVGWGADRGRVEVG